jgi:hypothetical protein
MRRSVRIAVAAALLAGPTVLAFFDGGYFTGPRLAALVVTYVLLAAAAAATARPSPQAQGGQTPSSGAEGGQTPLREVEGGKGIGARPDASLRNNHAAVAAVGGLALLAAWTAASVTWAPVEAPAVDARERVLLYLGAVVAALLAFRERRPAQWVEPALTAGMAVAVGYGLLDQFALVDLEDSAAAGGRLYHPLTYWNAEGALAAMGLVLAVRVAGDRARARPLRLGAAALTPLLGVGLYLTFSRGALTACAVGLAVLLALTPTWSQVRAAAIGLEATALAVFAAEALPRELAAVPLVALMLLAASLQEWSAQAEEQERTRLGPLPGLGRVRALAWTAAALLALAPFAAAAIDRNEVPRDPEFGATAERLGSVGSNRFGYWEVALETFADDPAIGAGAGGFATAWLERREAPEVVRDAHSLWLETAAELGLVGLAFLLLAFAGVVAAALRSARTDPGLAAGPISALAVWAAHSAIDWDWELPALTLVAAVLAGVVLARAADG